MTKRQLIALVEEGKLDSVLGELYDAILHRRRYLHDRQAAKNARKMEVGVKVQVVGLIKPKYLHGNVGTVVERPSYWPQRRTKRTIPVDFGECIGKYGPLVEMPASCLKIVDD